MCGRVHLRPTAPRATPAYATLAHATPAWVTPLTPAAIHRVTPDASRAVSPTTPRYVLGRSSDSPLTQRSRSAGPRLIRHTPTRLTRLTPITPRVARCLAWPASPRLVQVRVRPPLGCGPAANHHT
eukprot:scaffold18788_cov62-Phaeocystis_antarctica.AAC.5